MMVCSPTPILEAVGEVSTWFIRSSQNVIAHMRCSGDIDTASIFEWVNANMGVMMCLMLALGLAAVVLSWWESEQLIE